MNNNNNNKNEDVYDLEDYLDLIQYLIYKGVIFLGYSLVFLFILQNLFKIDISYNSLEILSSFVFTLFVFNYPLIASYPIEETIFLEGINKNDSDDDDNNNDSNAKN